jgi:F0F1-type ATP synthase membrane subunit b/b'
MSFVQKREKLMLFLDKLSQYESKVQKLFAFVVFIPASVLFLVGGLLIAGSAVAIASGAGHAPSISDLTFPWINFILYVALLTYLLRTPIRQGWQARRNRVKADVEGAADRLQAAERELVSVEALVHGVPQEQVSIKAEVSKQAELEAEMIVAQAEERGARIKQQAKEMLAGEMRSAQSAFKSRLIERALGVARQRFGAGDFDSRESVYTETAVTKAKQLVQ